MKNFALTLALLCVAFCSSYFACKQSPVQPTTPHNPLNLRAVLVSPVQVVLNWSNPANAANTYQLLRNGTAIARDTVPTVDTLGMYKDSSTLVPGTMYTYILNRLVNSAPYDSDTLQVRTLDTTKDNYTWTERTFPGSAKALYGIWGLTPQSVWMCGFTDSGTVLHYQNGVITYYHPNLSAIYSGCYGLSDTSVYFSGTDNIAYFNGKSFRYFLFTTDSAFQNDSCVITGLNFPTENFNSLYVAPDGEIFAITNNGAIVHRKIDSTWEVQQPAMPLSLTSIIGFSVNEIYAAGGDGATQGILLKYNGSSWSQILQSGQDSTMQVLSMNVGGDSGDSLIVVGSGVYHRFGAGWQNRTPSIEAYYAEGVCAQGWNNIFVCGAAGMFFKFDGVRWVNYGGHIFPYNAGEYLYNISVIGGEVFITGADNNGGIFIHGI